MGLISSKISLRPEICGISVLPAAISEATLARQSSRPSSQSKLAFWSASRSGTARGSRIFAKEWRAKPGDRGVLTEVFATKTVPSRAHLRRLREPRARSFAPNCQIRPEGTDDCSDLRSDEGSAKRQHTRGARRCLTRGCSRQSLDRTWRRGVTANRSPASPGSILVLTDPHRVCAWVDGYWPGPKRQADTGGIRRFVSWP